MRKALVILAAFACGLLARELVPSKARADKTVTYLSAGVVWDSYTAWPDPSVPGGIRAEICAHALVQGGGNGPILCEQATLGAANQTAIDTVTLATGKGVTLWKTRQGL